jgi:hypothetical protein
MGFDDPDSLISHGYRIAQSGLVVRLVDCELVR